MKAWLGIWEQCCFWGRIWSANTRWCVWSFGESKQKQRPFICESLLKGWFAERSLGFPLWTERGGGRLLLPFHPAQRPDETPGWVSVQQRQMQSPFPQARSEAPRPVDTQAELRGVVSELSCFKVLSFSLQMTEGRQVQVHLLDGRKLELLVQVPGSRFADFPFPEFIVY